MKTKEERKDDAYEEYKKIQEPAWKEYEKIIESAWKEYLKKQKPAWKEYQKKCEEINNEEIEEIIEHNGRKYKLMENGK